MFSAPTGPWAVILQVLVVAITVAVNVPLNDALKAAGKPATIPDLAAVRAAFDESRWQAWNLVRTVLAVVAFGLLAWALVVQARFS